MSKPRPELLECDVLCGLGKGVPYIPNDHVETRKHVQWTESETGDAKNLHKRDLLDFKLPLDILPSGERLKQVKDIIENVETGLEEDLIHEKNVHNKKTIKYQCLSVLHVVFRYCKYLIIAAVLLGTMLGGYGEGMKYVNMAMNPKETIVNALHNNETIHGRLLNRVEDRWNSLKKLVLRDTSKIDYYETDSQYNVLPIMELNRATEISPVHTMFVILPYNRTHDYLSYNETIEYTYRNERMNACLYQSHTYIPNTEIKVHISRTDEYIVDWRQHVNDLWASSQRDAAFAHPLLLDNTPYDARQHVLVSRQSVVNGSSNNDKNNAALSSSSVAAADAIVVQTVDEKITSVIPSVNGTRASEAVATGNSTAPVVAISMNAGTDTTTTTTTATTTTTTTNTATSTTTAGAIPTPVPNV